LGYSLITELRNYYRLKTIAVNPNALATNKAQIPNADQQPALENGSGNARSSPGVEAATITSVPPTPAVEGTSGLSGGTSTAESGTSGGLGLGSPGGSGKVRFVDVVFLIC
jgi:hypothetical protein